MSKARCLVVQNSEGSGPRRLLTWLPAHGVECDVRLGSDGLPSSLAGYAGLVLLGGGLLPDDDERAPWLPHERQLCREAIDRDFPTLGICLGGQVLAHVAGGEVRAKYGTPERGATEIRVTAEGERDRLFASLAPAAPMIENHEDQITALPPAAVHLAASAHVPVQAFRLGTRVWGLQFHPEAQAGDIATWNDAALREEGHEREALLRAAEAAHESNTRAAEGLIAAFAEIIKQYAGQLETRETP